MWVLRPSRFSGALSGNCRGPAPRLTVQPEADDLICKEADQCIRQHDEGDGNQQHPHGMDPVQNHDLIDPVNDDGDNEYPRYISPGLPEQFVAMQPVSHQSPHKRLSARASILDSYQQPDNGGHQGLQQNPYPERPTEATKQVFPGSCKEIHRILGSKSRSGHTLNAVFCKLGT